MNETWTNSPREISEILERWRGVKAEAVAYTASHGVLVLRLYGDRAAWSDSPRCAYIQCRDCQTIQLFQTCWEPADISISSAPHRLGTVYTVHDPGRLHVICWTVSLRESERPINFHREWSHETNPATRFPGPA